MDEFHVEDICRLLLIKKRRRLEDLFVENLDAPFISTLLGLFMFLLS